MSADKVDRKANSMVQVTILGANSAQELDWCAPTEVPIGMVYNKTPHSVMMATPENLHDFAFGYALAEGVINRADELFDMSVHHLAKGLELHMTIPEKRMERLDLHGQRRAHFGRAGCGICGVDRLEDAIRPLPKLPDSSLRVSHKIAGHVANSLGSQQPLRLVNKSVHGAAWVNSKGEITIVREDIGRHNALDKLIGACARDGVDFDTGFALLSSRCTFELAQKCALAGISALLTLSAPSASAIDTAKRANVNLASWDRSNNALVVFTGDIWTSTLHS